MSNQLLASKVVIQEEDPQIRQITGVLTNKLGLVGVTEKGPFGPTLISSPAEYRKNYGGYVGAGEVAQAIDGFFTNGGARCVVSRVVHYADPTDPTTKTSAAATKSLQTGATSPSAGTVAGTSVAPFLLAPNQTLVVSRDATGNATATFTAVQASRASGNGPYTLTNGQTLTFSIDGGPTQTITFATGNFVSISAATPAEVAAVINSGMTGGHAAVVGSTVVLYSDKVGTASGVNVTGGTANTALAFTTGNVAGTGNVGNILAVTAAEAATVIQGAVSGVTVASVGGQLTITSATTGGASLVQVVSSSTATGFGFDNASHVGGSGAQVNTITVAGKYDGAYANALSLKVADATNGDAIRFNLLVLKAGIAIETWPNLTMDPSDARYVVTVINDADNGSTYISVTDLLLATANFITSRPVDITTTAMTGGSDGLTSLADTDFLGGVGPNGRTGMQALNTIDDLALLAIPGRATAAVHNGMIAYCEVTRSMSVFAILDPPAGTSATGIVTYVSVTAALENLSEFGGIYWPRVQVLNPSTAVFGATTRLYVAPSGYVAGAMARTDNARQGGVYTAAAGVDNGVLLGVLGFESDETLDENKRDIVYPHRINPLTTQKGFPRYIDGSYTLKGTGNFPSVPERRGVIYIEQSIKAGVQFARHKNNDETLREEVSRTIDTFLAIQMNNSAFRSKDPKTAYFVDVGAGLNPPAVQFAGKLVGRVGLATQKPAQFVILSFSQDTRAFDQAAAA